MKSIPIQTTYFSLPLKVAHKDSSTTTELKSPFLQAILSGKSNPVQENKTASEYPDRDAAIRYIKESAIPKK